MNIPTVESKHVNIVWTVLSGIPVNIEEDSVLRLSNIWELVEPRAEDNSREIGSANLLSCVNLLTASLLAENKNIPAIAYFNSILVYLESNHKIRKKPDRVRKGFKIVSNE